MSNYPESVMARHRDCWVWIATLIDRLKAEQEPALWPEVLDLCISTPYWREAKARSEGRSFVDLSFLLEKGKDGKKIW